MKHHNLKATARRDLLTYMLVFQVN